MPEPEKPRRTRSTPPHRRSAGPRWQNVLRVVGYAILILLVAVPIAFVGAAYLAIEDEPMVSGTAALTPVHIERAKRIVEQNDPRRIKTAALRTLTLSQEDLDLALNYLAGRYARASSRIVLHPGAAAIAATVELPANPIGRFLNVTASLHGTGGLPRFDQLQIGRLPVPARVADWMLDRALGRFDGRDGYRVVSDTVRKVDIAEGRLTVIYDWQSDLADRLRTAMLPSDEQVRLRAFQERLAEAAGQSGGGALALGELLIPLFKLAAQRAATGDPIAENRAAIVVLAFYVNGRGIGAIVPAARDWPRPPLRKIVLAGRDDLPQHFALSAAIAATAGGPLADAIGLYKEVDDSRAGSGFSFTDIAADRAGTRFGETAVSDRESASKLQRVISAGARESDLMPPVSGLPESMSETVFKRRFGGVGTSAYARVMDDIERRIAALPLYR